MSYRNEKVSVFFKGSGLSGLTFLVFLVLKLCKVIDWSWWWITAPLWGQLALVILFFAIVGIVYGIMKLTRRWRRHEV